MNLQILTTVWGDKHIDLFFKTALKSLTWASNLEALKKVNAKWNIFTDKTEIVQNRIPKDLGITFNIQSTDKLRNYIDEVQSATIWQMKECLKSGDRLLLAPPDTIFGDGTIEGLIGAGQDEHSVVVVPHPRVLPSIVETILVLDVEICNPWLMNISWDHLHDSWVHAERGHPNQSSYVGGVEWWRAGNGLIQGTHRLPSPYLIHFTEEDLRYFESAISFGHFDHMWPGDILIPRGRQRYIASSDSAFIVEITETDKNVPPIIENQPKTGFWRDNLHNRHNAQIIFTFKKIKIMSC